MHDWASTFFLRVPNHVGAHNYIIIQLYYVDLTSADALTPLKQEK